MLQDGIEYPYQFAACCDDGLLALERILLSGGEILIYLAKLGIVLNHGQHDLEQNLSQPFPSSFADGASAAMLAGAVFLDLQPGQLLDLLW